MVQQRITLGPSAKAAAGVDVAVSTDTNDTTAPSGRKLLGVFRCAIWIIGADDGDGGKGELLGGGLGETEQVLGILGAVGVGYCNQQTRP